MTKITSFAMIDITIVGADGTQRTLKARDTADLSFDADNRHNKTLISAGAIAVDGRSAHSGAKKSPRRASRKSTKKSARKAQPASALPEPSGD